MKNLAFVICLGILSVTVHSQNILISEGFEGSTLPAGWTVSTNATDGGWILGTSQTIESQWWSVVLTEILLAQMMMIVIVIKAWII